jgi:hypothetical protein
MPRENVRAAPAYAWLGLALIAVSEAGMLARIEPFWSWHTPIAWTGYIMFVDGLVWRWRGNSLLRNNRAEAVFLALASVPLWLVFEQYNKHALHTWYYLGLPENRVVRNLGYVWAFATICPAIFETGELIGALRGRKDVQAVDRPPRVPLGRSGWLSVAAGIALLAAPFVYPSPWLAAPVWLGFIFLLDPINASLGAESIRGDLRAGRRSRLVNLLLGGLVCGVVWECWNYWARSKWIYNVPVPPHIKLFEMPLAGYGGFPPFAVECFVMYVFVRTLIWRGAWRPVAL